MRLIWVHVDCLHRQSPAYLAHPDAPSLFVWDDAELQRAGWALKRIGFIYECLLDLPAVIRRGDPVEELRRYASEMHCEGIVTMATPDPHLKQQIAALHAEAMPQEPFVNLTGKVDLKRFSRYWQKAQAVID
jgi:deoxyribodipyrimidine photo-lyase